ncbi:hypothetical protein DFH09DRAFT_1102653 [Mycena vulgaris]|nr:hypothetical protein DFH09DRAFT_1102653 [Mycena vulgaris]
MKYVVELGGGTRRARRALGISPGPLSCKTRQIQIQTTPPPPPLEKKKRAEAQDDDNNARAPPGGPENEQRIEDAETLKMTEKQRLSLFHSFRSVKFEWSDLDGNDTACALCAAATMKSRRAAQVKSLPALGFTVSPPAPLGSVRKLERKRRTATTLLGIPQSDCALLISISDGWACARSILFMNISTLYSSNVLISIHNTGAKRRPTMHKPLLSGEKGQGVEL